MCMTLHFQGIITCEACETVRTRPKERQIISTRRKTTAPICWLNRWQTHDSAAGMIIRSVHIPAPFDRTTFSYERRKIMEFLMVLQFSLTLYCSCSTNRCSQCCQNYKYKEVPLIFLQSNNMKKKERFNNQIIEKDARAYSVGTIKFISHTKRLLPGLKTWCNHLIA